VKFRRLAAMVFSSPWAIRPEKLAMICELVELRQRGVRFTREEIRSRIGSPPSSGPLTRQTGSRIAILNLFGVIAPRMNAIEESSGGTSCEMFGKAFDAAVRDTSVAKIILNIDSPGGSAIMVPETAAKIFAARGIKPIIAVVNGQMASAAYWIGCAADEIVMTPSGEAGSIGVVMVHTDESQADAQAGIKRTVITSAPRKFAGNPFEPLSEDSKRLFQERVQSIHFNFISAVARYRGVSTAKVEADFGQGATLLAADAVAAGLVDRIATFDELLTELGADAAAQPAANAPPLPPFPPTEGRTMNKDLFAQLVKMGLCAADTSEAAARVGLTAYFAGRGVAPIADDAAALVALQTLSQITPAAAAAVPVVPPVAPTATNGASNPAGMAHADILASVRLANIPAAEQMALAQELLGQASTLTTAQVLQRVNTAAAAHNPPAGVVRASVTADAIDKFQVAARDALLERTYSATSSRPAQIYDGRTRTMVEWRSQAGGSNHLQSLPRLVEACLLQCGIPYSQVSQLTPADLAYIALGKPLNQVGIYAADGMSYNVSGMFSNIFLDASNVILRQSYNETPTTFQMWMRQGESLKDFKPVHKVILGELADPKAIPEDGEFDETTTTDGKESYKLTVWGSVFSMTWQMIMGDMISAFVRLQQMQSSAMRRKQNKLGYGVLIDNGNLADGGALFNATAVTSTGGHANLTTGAGAPSVATLNSLTTKMMQQTGLNVADSTVLGLMPRYLPHPPALRGTVLELLGSTSNPASTNANTKNIWQNGLEPICEAQLSAAAGGSDTAWYLAADPSQVDTVEYAYLQGYETPAFDQVTSFDRLAIRQRIYQAFAVKALDYRGLQKHAGG